MSTKKLNIMANVHFFCEFNKLLVLPSQSSQEFGSVGSIVYNLTSWHTLNVTSKAFAMFEGEIRYQRDNSSNNSSFVGCVFVIKNIFIIKNYD